MQSSSTSAIRSTASAAMPFSRNGHAPHDPHDARDAHPVHEGSVLRITAPDAPIVYARVLADAHIAIYEPPAHSRNIAMTVSDICGLPVLWTLPVTAAALRSGRWPVIGHRALEPQLAAPVRYFVWDRQAGQFDAYRADRSASERAARSIALPRHRVWQASHVEERIRDYLAGRAGICAVHGEVVC